MRTTLAKQICQQIAEGFTFSDVELQELVSLGKVLTDLEREFKIYYHSEGMRKHATQLSVKQAGNNLPPQVIGHLIEGCNLAREGAKMAITEIFLKAVDKHDVEAILEIARIVSFFKSRADPRKYVDSDRGWLVYLKDVLIRQKRTMTVRQIAELIAGKAIPTPPDGFSALRRKYLEIGVPLAEPKKRKIRHK